MTCPVVAAGNLTRDALASACSLCRRCLTVAIDISPNGDIFEHRIAGEQHLLLTYWADRPEAPTLAELTSKERPRHSRTPARPLNRLAAVRLRNLDWGAFVLAFAAGLGLGFIVGDKSPPRLAWDSKMSRRPGPNWPAQRDRTAEA